MNTLFTAYLMVNALMTAFHFWTRSKPHDQPPKNSGEGSSSSREDEAADMASPERRRLLSLLSVGMAGGAATLVGLPIVGFILSPMLKKEDDVWRDVGPVSAFSIGQTSKVTFLDPSPLSWSGPAATSAAWLWRVDEGTFVAFKVNCTHLGCAVRWEPGPRFFMCPCHGGVFYQDGSVAAGPPSEPLHRYKVRLRESRVEILTGPVPITSGSISRG